MMSRLGGALVTLAFAALELTSPAHACGTIQTERRAIQSTMRNLQAAATAKANSDEDCKALLGAIASLEGSSSPSHEASRLLVSIQQNPECLAADENFRNMVTVYLLEAAALLLRSEDPADLNLAGTLAQQTADTVAGSLGGMIVTFHYYNQAHDLAKLNCSLENQALASCLQMTAPDPSAQCQPSPEPLGNLTEIRRMSVDAGQIARAADDQSGEPTEAQRIAAAFEYLGSKALSPAGKGQALQELCTNLLALPTIPQAAKGPCGHKGFAEAAALPHSARACRVVESLK